jgi:3-oxoacyl-[acyl-carrier protein] reductase
MNTTNEKILITGGTKGIGKAVARVLAASGYELILTYGSDHEGAKKTADELVRDYDLDEVTLLSADISEQSSIMKIKQLLDEKGIMLTAVIFNAGLTCRDSFEDISQEDWNRVMRANVNFPVFLLQKIIKRIKKGGSVVFTGSLMGIEPHSVSLAYGVTKSAVHALVKNLVKFLAPYDVRVNGVAPGFVDTEWQKNKPTEIRRNIENKVALGRFCEPMEVAEVYLMLIENTYFNGEIVVIDGGYSYK